MLDTLSIALADALPEGWHLTSCRPAGARLRVLLAGPDARAVAFSVSASVQRSGPFDVGGASVAYERTDVPFAVLAPAGRALASALLATSPDGDVAGAVAAALEAPGGRGAGPAGSSATAGLRDVTIKLAGEASPLDGTGLQGIRQLTLLVAAGESDALRVQLAGLLVDARASAVGEIVIHAPVETAAWLAAALGREPEPPSTVVLRGRCHGPDDARRLADAAKVVLSRTGRRVVLVHELDAAGAACTPALVSACAEMAGDSRLQLMVALLSFDGRASHFAQRAPTLAGLADSLRAAAARAADLDLELVVAPGPGLPSCALPEGLRPGPDHARRALTLPGHAEAAYGEGCVACTLRVTCPGVQQAWLATFGAQELRPVLRAGGGAALSQAEARAGWQERARALLVDRPSARVPLTDLIPPAALPPIACVLPWTAFEHSPGGASGPCCANYQARPQLAARGADHRTLWNGKDMRAFRRAMAAEAQPSTCSSSCPILRGGGKRLDQLRLQGGPAAAVDAQLGAVEDMLDGREIARGGPLELRFATTTFCNYDCLMCSYGELGTLDDEAGDPFYDAVRELLPGLLVLEALGGEPLASPRFRRFLEDTPFGDTPQLGVALVTNASYLTPKQLERLAHVPLTDLTISINAASEEAYLAVNRGLPWPRIREHLDALHAARRAGRLATAVKYSMVILRANLGEIEAFADLAWGDGVDVRFRLPNDDRNGQSIMTDRALMESALAALERVARSAWERGAGTATHELLGVTRVLAQRLEDGLIEVLR